MDHEYESIYESGSNAFELWVPYNITLLLPAAHGGRPLPMGGYADRIIHNTIDCKIPRSNGLNATDVH